MRMTAYLDFEREVFLQIFDDHDKEWQLNSQRLLWVGWTGDKCGGHIAGNYLQHKRLDVIVCYSFDVTIADLKTD